MIALTISLSVATCGAYRRPQALLRHPLNPFSYFVAFAASVEQSRIARICRGPSAKACDRLAGVAGIRIKRWQSVLLSAVTGTILVADGEQVVDVPAKLSARLRFYATGQGRKTDDTDAHSIALVGVRMSGLRPVVSDQQLAAGSVRNTPSRSANSTNCCWS